MSSYTFTLSFAPVDSTDNAPPAVTLPPNVTPVIPPIGSTLIVPTGSDSNLVEGIVQSISYNIAAGQTIVTITFTPTIGVRKK